ncbi:MAG TPA: hypothetical protein VN721_13215 [Flavipsychrobacter sp.]|nr:hypothetical protein [Flavipsychrobacter sp.]
MDHELVTQMFMIMLLGLSNSKCLIQIIADNVNSLVHRLKGHIMVLTGHLINNQLRSEEIKRYTITLDVPFKNEPKQRNRFDWHF